MDRMLSEEIYDRVCKVCRSSIELRRNGELFVACRECGYPVCRVCCDFICTFGSCSCPKCHSVYQRPEALHSLVDDDLQCTADSWECNSRCTSNFKDLEDSGFKRSWSFAANYSIRKENNVSHYSRKTSAPLDVPGKSVKAKKSCPSLRSHLRRNWACSYPSSGIWGRRKGCFLPASFPSYPVPPRQTLRPQASALMSFRTNFWKERLSQWKLARQNVSRGKENAKNLQKMDHSSPLTEDELDQLEMDEELRQPLSRKVPLPPSKINPYRVVIFFRLIVLAFFLQYRIANPVRNAYGLWLTSVICEAWFSLSWILDQLPKWQPINRETYPERLCLRFNPSRNQCQLPCIDVFVTKSNHLKEPPLVMSNTVLSILAVDYPADRITCYVSDDGADFLTLETLSETCQFARKWVPFCRRYKIEPRCPESYFSQKVDYLKYNIFPAFSKERRAMKRQYEEFKVQINLLVGKFRAAPSCGWTMRDGTPWPGNNIHNHPAMVQILSGRNEPHDNEGEELPQVVYVCREKHPNYQHNKKAGALNALIRVSAILSDGAYILNLDCDHYINNSKAFLEAMSFMMDPRTSNKACFVQFPQSFDGVDPSDRYANHSAIFYDINLKGLDGIQGPFYVGTGCFVNRKALYGYDPPSDPKCYMPNYCRSWKENVTDECDYASTHPREDDSLRLFHVERNSLESETPVLSLKKCFGQSSIIIALITGKDERFLQSAAPDDLLKEAIHVMSCDYEDDTAWGRGIGWIYGSLNFGMLTSLTMHARGWRSIYCMPSPPAFKGTAPIDIYDRLNQVLKCALGSVDIFFSRHCPVWYAYSGELRWLQRVAYINATIYPITSIPLVVYCTLPAVCLITGKFIVASITKLGSIWIALLFLSIFATEVLEMRWSGVGPHDWWRNQQFWVIGGVSSNLFAVLKMFLCKKGDLTLLTQKSVQDDFKELYAFRRTSLLIMPTTIILINFWGMVAGISSAMNGGYGSWGPLFVKLFFSFWVVIHLYPFLKGLLVRQHRVPTVVVVWSLLFATLFSMLWVRVNPFVTSFQGPNVQNCGIYC